MALSATPLKLISGWTWPMRVRRMLGLWAFAYVALHLTSYVVLDQFFDWRAIGMDIVKRTYITVGMGAFIILATLAATSPKRVIKRLGGQAWKRIHKYIYIAGIMGCWHYYWMVKADTLPPLIHAAVLGVLLAIRLGYSYRPKKRLGS
ncbi:MAG: sulfoxide reductase heme-binding subunit YedZ [Magnetovibrio sp.]|nr:sulfoxide reductase heme-binding subunit YedZ [Magnetovibrio sp.]